MTLNAIEESNWKYEPVPRSAVRLYRMIWQLETWLRTMVYVELKASQVDWEENLKKHTKDWPPRSLENDKKLYHMSTCHQASISYINFGELWNVISDKDNWPLFELYFPPKDNTDVRIKEIKTIRNRIAHFREPNQNDTDRLSLFMRDMELGIRRFCTRYTAGKMVADHADDPVTENLSKMWDGRTGYGIELHRPDNGWFYAPEPHRMNPYINADLSLLTHNNYVRGSLKGTIYRLSLRSNHNHKFSTKQFFLRTRSFHEKLIHLFIPVDLDGVTVTISAIHGINETTEIIAKLLDAGRNCIHSLASNNLDEEKSIWPEYVIWPDDILSMFDPEIPEPILDLLK